MFNNVNLILELKTRIWKVIFFIFRHKISNIHLMVGCPFNNC